MAVVHGPAEAGYVGASEAMVNIRATLARAADEGVSAGCVMLGGGREGTHFADRYYAALLAAGRR